MGEMMRKGCRSISSARWLDSGVPAFWKSAAASALSTAVATLLLPLFGPSLAGNPPAVVSAFVGSVAKRVTLTQTQCPEVFTQNLAPGAAMLCFTHHYTSFQAFKSSWDTDAVWPGRFGPVEDWIAQTVPSGTVHLRLYRLDDTGIMVMFTPGSPGTIAFLISDIATANQSPPATPLPASSPLSVMVQLNAENRSSAMLTDGKTYTTLDRPCKAADSICSTTVVGQSATTIMAELGLSTVGWRVQPHNGGTLYSTADGPLLIAIAENTHGVAVTAAKIQYLNPNGNVPIEEAP